MNINHPDQLLRKWEQYSLVVTHLTSIAASAKSVETLKIFGEFCFGCNQAHDPTKCSFVAAIVASHPQYRRVINAKRTDPMRIPQDGYTLLVPPVFALVINNS